jgi:hypothetical protein
VWSRCSRSPTVDRYKVFRTTQTTKLGRRRRSLTARRHAATVYAITSLPAWQADSPC